MLPYFSPYSSPTHVPLSTWTYRRGRSVSSLILANSQRLLYSQNFTKPGHAGFPVCGTKATVLLRPVNLSTSKSFPVWDLSLRWQVCFWGSSSKFVSTLYFKYASLKVAGVAFYLEKRKIFFSFSVSQGTMTENVLTEQSKTQKMNTTKSGMF